MRIAFVVRYLCDGGAERVTSLLATGFSSMGHEVLVTSFAQRENEYPVGENVCVRYVPDGSTVARVRAFKEMIDSFKPDAVISLGSKYDYIWLAGIFKKYKTILSERNDPSRKQSLPKKLFINFCFNKANGIVFQTPYAESYCKGETRNSTVILNPAPANLPTWQKENHDKAVINCCRLMPQKNLPLLVRSFARFHVSHPDYKLAIYGDGPLRAELSTLVSELGMAESIQIYSYSPDIHQVMARSAMFVSSSDFEGISNSLLEAISMGVPVISTDSHGGGSRLLLKDGQCGELVPCGDEAALAAAMARVADDSVLAQGYSVQEMARVEELSLKSICDKWLDFINRCA